MIEKTPAPPPKLCLVVETRNDPEWCARVGAALDATAAVTLVLAPPGGATSIPPDLARPLIELAQAREVAVLLVDDCAAAREARADGVHLTWRPDIETAFGIARAELGPRSIVGVEAGASRHDAMSLGEAGADYVAFPRAPGDESALDVQSELIAWWSELFVVPAVAYGVETAEQAARLARSGADFIAVHLPAGLSTDAIEVWAGSLVDAVRIDADAA